MRHVNHQQWFVTVAAIGLVSACAGWIHGACHKVCEVTSCNSLPEPIDGYACYKSDQSSCSQSHEVYFRSFSTSVCTDEVTGIINYELCDDCDPDCTDDPSDADDCAAPCTDDDPAWDSSYYVCENP